MCFNLFTSQISGQSINSKIRTFVQQGSYSQALQFYSKNSNPHLQITKFTFPSLLKACSSLSNLSYGKTIHSTIIVKGFHFDPYIATSLISMYVKCGLFSSAVHVFDNMSESEALAHDITIWNSIIDGCYRYGFVEEGMGMFRKMQVLGVRPDGYSLSILLGVLDGGLGCLEVKQVHACIVRNMFDGDPYLETALIEMYSRCNRIIDAWRVFEKLENKNNVVAWNVMISGFGDNGLWQRSLELFSMMKKECRSFASTTFTSVFTACSNGENLCFGKQIHCDVIKMRFLRDPYICNSLLTMYAKNELIEDARKVFDETRDQKIEIWNAMIASYVSKGYIYDAFEAYNLMRVRGIESDSFTISSILSACSMIELCDLGRVLHGDLIKRPVQSNLAVQSAVLTMYSKLGSTKEACLVFNMMKEKDLVAWGSMISGFCRNKKFEEAFELIITMEGNGVVPDSDIMASVVNACIGLEDIELGFAIHGYVVKRGFHLDVFVATSLIDMYSKFGSPEMAGKVFSGIVYKNLVVWNSMISCYCKNGLPEHSITLFPQIMEHGLYPDSVSITSVLTAVSSVAALLKGKTIHGYQIRLEIPIDIQVKNGLIDMYIKCGSLNNAQSIFQTMRQRNLVTWNSLIDGYGSHGNCVKAISLFEEMKESRILPDNVTFLSLISSCSHSGFVEKGLAIFESMKNEYKIEPKMEHYVNIVDLLGRSGRVNDAYNFINNMPIEPDRSIWLCLLGSCRVHRNMKLGELAADNLLSKQPTRGSNYAQVMNMYGDAELWDKAAEIRGSMREKGLKKKPGCSWIEIGSRIDVFFSGDSSLTSTVEIYETLTCLRRNMQEREDFREAIPILQTI